MLALDKVSKVYPNGVHALERFSAEISPGEIVAIIGGSGCGKSTLLRAISGLDRPSQGRIVLDGEPITEPHEKIGIRKMITTTDALTEWPVVMATAVLAMLPPVFVVVVMQKLFVRGLVETEK